MKPLESMEKLKAFLNEVKVELVKCSWPTRRELFGQSVVVIVSVLVLGAFVGVFDLLNMGLLNLIIR